MFYFKPLPHFVLIFKAQSVSPGCKLIKETWRLLHCYPQKVKGPLTGPFM
jgi:hypothetical protein